MRELLRLAGLGQLVLCVASLWIPKVLGWRDELAKLRVHTKKVFVTYSIYIWATNLAFALLSAAAPTLLLDGSPLARAVSGFIALYWGGRLLLQLAYYERTEHRLAEAALTALFLGLTAVYGFASAA